MKTHSKTYAEKHQRKRQVKNIMFLLKNTKIKTQISKDCGKVVAKSLRSDNIRGRSILSKFTSVC